MLNPTGNVLLAGASGYIGRAVASQLLSEGYAVTALVRDTATDLQGCTKVVVKLSEPQAVHAALAGQQFDAVISCIASRTGAPKDSRRVDYEANRTLLDVAVALDIGHFILLSAICVQRPKLAFQHAKLAFEADLKSADIDYTVVRPTAFFKSLSGQIKRVQAGKSFLLFGDGQMTACKPISESDLAKYIAAAVTDKTMRNRILPIGGPGEALTPLEQGALLFELTGREPRYRHVPVAMFTVAIAILAPLSKVIPALAAKAEFARIGRYYATESMLLWDSARGVYDADATPSTGTDSLRQHYARVLDEGMAGQETGDHKLF